MKTKKVVLSIVISLLLVLGLGQVYAKTVLNQDLLTVLSESFTTLKTNYLNNSKNDLNKIKRNYESDINKFIDSEVKDLKSQLDSYKAKRLENVEVNMSQYIAELKKEISNRFDGEKEQLIESIDETLTEGEQNIKSDINEHLKKIIQQRVK